MITCEHCGRRTRTGFGPGKESCIDCHSALEDKKAKLRVKAGLSPERNPTIKLRGGANSAVPSSA